HEIVTGPTHELDRILEDDLQGLRGQFLGQIIQHDFLESTIGDNPFTESLHSIWIVAALPYIENHPLMLGLQTRRQDFRIGPCGEQTLVRAPVGREDLASQIDQRFDGGIGNSLVLGLDVVNPPVMLHIRVVSGDHANPLPIRARIARSRTGSERRGTRSRDSLSASRTLLSSVAASVPRSPESLRRECDFRTYWPASSESVP